VKYCPIIVLVMILCFSKTEAQLAVNTGQTAQALAQNITGSGVTVSNAVLTCSATGASIFDGSNSNIGLNSGVLLTTGPGTIAIGPNNTPDAGLWEITNTPFVDNDLATILPNTLYDGCMLEFDVVPLGNELSFRYIFASEEYPEYVCSDFNDVFAFFISGPGIVGKKNIALIPGTSTAVAINSVNPGQAGSSCLIPLFCTCTSLAYGNLYTNNNNGTTVQYDGFTTVLTAQSIVTACETYRLKLVIADAGDGVYDSGVFIEEASLNSNIPVVTQSSSDVFEGCKNGFIDFATPAPVGTATTIQYVISGTATNGVDYQQINNSITIPAGQTATRLDIITIPDTINDPTETIELYIYTLLCDTLFYDTVTVILKEELPVLNVNDTTICKGEQVQLQVNGGVTYEWIPPINLTNPNIANPVFNGDTTTGYIVITIDSNNCRGRGFLTVFVLDPPTPIFNPVTDICIGDTAQLSVSGGINYSWSPSLGLSSSSISNPKAFPTTNTDYTVRVSIGNCADTIQLRVNVNPLPIANAGNDTTVCRNTNILLNASGGNNYSWSPANTLNNANIANPTANITATTSYIVTVTNGIGCFDIDTVLINSVDPLSIIASNDVIKCAEDTIALTVIGANNYVWTPNINITNANTDNPSVFPNINTLYTVSAIDINGCPTSDSVFVSITITTPPNAGLDQSICEGETVSIGGNPTSENNSILVWTATSGDINALSSLNAQNPVFDASVSGTGIIIFQVTETEQGCFAGTDEVSIAVNALPVADFSGLKELYCLESPASILTGNPTGGIFNGIGIVNNSFDPRVAGIGNYFEITYSVTDANGCFDDTTKVTLVTNYLVDAGEDQTINIFDSIQLMPSSDAVIYEWSPAESLSCFNCMNPFASPTVTTTYNLIAIDENGCVSEDNVTVNVFVDTLLWVPNAFSPNGDGSNDIFRVYGKNFKTIEFKVFNRWGELVFFTTDPSQGWDGTYKGKEMVPGVYVYSIKATYINDLQSRREKGSFVLVK